MSLADPNLESLVQDAERSASDAALRVLGDALLDASEADRLMLLRRWVLASRDLAKRRKMLQPQTLIVTREVSPELARAPAAELAWVWESIEREILHNLSRLLRLDEWFAIRLHREDTRRPLMAYGRNGSRVLRLQMDVDPVGR